MKRIAAHYVFDGEQLIKNGVVELDESGVIISVSQARPNIVEAEGMAFYNGIIMPGFVNMHCHLELSNYWNTIPKHIGMAQFIDRVMDLRNVDVNRSLLNQAMLNADRKMFQSGISVVADVSNTTHSVEVKTNSHIHYHTFVESAGTNSFDFRNRINQFEKILEIFNENGLSASLSLHSLYSVCPDLFSEILKRQDSILSVHFYESKLEADLFDEEKDEIFAVLKEIDSSYQIPNIENYLSKLLNFAKTKNLIPVHNVAIPDNILHKLFPLENVFPCVCIKSNKFIHNNIPNIPLINTYSKNIVVGTDSLASNDSLSIISELMCISQEFPEISLQTMLGWITRNGALALQLEQKFGSFKQGMCPGVVLLQGIDLHNLKLTDKTTSIRLI